MVQNEISHFDVNFIARLDYNLEQKYFCLGSLVKSLGLTRKNARNYTVIEKTKVLKAMVKLDGTSVDTYDKDGTMIPFINDGIIDYDKYYVTKEDMLWIVNKSGTKISNEIMSWLIYTYIPHIEAEVKRLQAENDYLRLEYENASPLERLKMQQRCDTWYSNYYRDVCIKNNDKARQLFNHAMKYIPVSKQTEFNDYVFGDPETPDDMVRRRL